MPFSFQVQQMPQWYEGSLKSLAERAQAAATEQHHPYRDLRLAPLHPDILRAGEMSRQTGLHRPLYDEAEQIYRTLASSNFPGSHQAYMNPYQDAVVRRLEDESLRTFNQKILPALEGRFVRLGQHGGSRHQAMARQAARDMEHDIAERRHRALAHGYSEAQQQFNTDKARRLMAAQQLAEMGRLRQASHLGDITSLGTYGSLMQERGQKARDLDYEQYLRELQRPVEGLSQWASVMHGLPYSRATSLYENPQSAPPQMNMLGNLGQLASSFLGMRSGMR